MSNELLILDRVAIQQSYLIVSGCPQPHQEDDCNTVRIRKEKLETEIIYRNHDASEHASNN